jgi:hypothetical protein
MGLPNADRVVDDAYHLSHGECVHRVTGIATCLLVVALVASVAAGVASGSTGAAVSPQALYRESLAAGHAQQSVHWTSRASGGGALVAMTCDVGRTAGIQRISYSGGGRSGKATVLVVGGNAYLRGDAFTLTGFMGLNEAAATKYANAWVEIPRGDRRFAAVAAGVTLHSAVDQVEMVAPFRALPAVSVHGQKALAIAGVTPGKQSAAVVFYARPAAPHLPVGAASKAAGYATSIFFSRWNEQVRVARPAHAVPIAQTGL